MRGRESERVKVREVERTRVDRWKDIKAERDGVKEHCSLILDVSG